MRNWLEHKIRLLGRIFLFWHLLLLKNSKAVLIVTCLILLFFASQLKNLKQVISVYDLLPNQFQSVKDLKETDEQFSIGRNIILFFERSDKKKFNKKDYCEIRNWFYEYSEHHTNLLQIGNPFELRGAEFKDRQLLYPRILELHCDDPADEQFGLKSLENSPWNNVLIGSNKNNLILDFHFDSTSIDPKFHAFNPQIVGEMKESLEKSFDQTKWNTSLVGVGTYEATIIKGIKSVKFVNFVLMILILITHRLFYGTFKSGAILFFSMLISVIILFGTISLVGKSLDLLSHSLLVMLTVSSLQDFAYVTFNNLDKPQVPQIKSFRLFILPCFFTSFTTMIGFGSLAISDIDMIKWFGIWAALGAFLEWFILFFILPPLMKEVRFFRTWIDPAKAIKLTPLKNSFKFIGPKFWLFTVILMLPIGVYSIKHLNFYDEPALMLEKDDPFSKDVETIKKNFSWESHVSLIFESDFSNERKKEILTKLKNNPLIAKIDSSQDVLQFLFNQSNNQINRLIELEFLKLAKPKRYFAENGREKAILFLKSSDIHKTKNLINEVQNLCPARECFVAGSLIAYTDFVASVAETLIESLSVSLILVIMIITFLMWAKRTPNVLLTNAAILWGPFLVFFILYFFDVPINMVTSVCAAVFIGLAGDNVIQFILASGNEEVIEGMNSRFTGAIGTSLMMAIGTLALLASYFHPPKMLGIIFSVGFIVCFIGDYWVLKNCLLWSSAKSGTDQS